MGGIRGKGIPTPEQIKEHNENREVAKEGLLNVLVNPVKKSHGETVPLTERQIEKRVKKASELGIKVEELDNLPEVVRRVVNANKTRV